MTTRCACGWSFDGSVGDGVIAAREHRRTAHPDLPTFTPDPRRKKESAAAEDARAESRREQVLEVLRAADRPLRAGEIAAQLDNVSAYRIGPILRFTPEARQVAGGRWWLVERDLPVEPPRQQKTSGVRQRVLNAVERLRDGGKETARTVEVATEAGVTPTSAGKALSIAGFRRVEQTTYDVRRNGSAWHLLPTRPL